MLIAIGRALINITANNLEVNSATNTAHSTAREEFNSLSVGASSAGTGSASGHYTKSTTDSKQEGLTHTASNLNANNITINTLQGTFNA